VNASYRLLRRIFNAAVEAGMISRNPCAGTKAPAPGTEEMRFLNAGEVAHLAASTPEQYQTLIFLLAYRGLRIGEAAALRIGDLDMLRSRVVVERAVSEVAGHLHVGPTKTGARRSVSLPPFLRKMLAEHLSAFPSRDGNVFTERWRPSPAAELPQARIRQSGRERQTHSPSHP
jgi:integrase